MTEQETLLHMLKNACAGDKAFSLAGMCQLTVFGDKGYRKQNFTGDEEFFVTDVREGKRSAYIFTLIPVDDQPFKHAEVETKDLALVKGLEEHLIGFLVEGGARSFKSACIQWTKSFRRAAEEVKEKAKKEIETEQAKTYADNPLWGAFHVERL